MQTGRRASSKVLRLASILFDETQSYLTSRLGESDDLSLYVNTEGSRSEQLSVVAIEVLIR